MSHPENLQDVEYGDLSDDLLVRKFNKSLGTYKDWVENEWELHESFVEEIEYLSFHRGELHTMVELLKHRKLDIDLDELKEIDKKWQNWILKKTAPGFSLEHSRDNKSKEYWWEWVDQLDNLSADEKSTL